MAHAPAGIQCNGCLALMSLVRGEGEVCQSNQWHIAKAGAIEAITAAMRRFRWAPSVLPPACSSSTWTRAALRRAALLGPATTHAA
jgi:hypothetical protein